MLFSLIFCWLCFTAQLHAVPAKIVCVPSAEASTECLSSQGRIRSYILAQYLFDQFCADYNTIRIVTARPDSKNRCIPVMQTASPLAAMLKKTISLPYPRGREGILASDILVDQFFHQALVIIVWPAESVADLLLAFDSAVNIDNANTSDRLYTIDAPFTKVHDYLQSLLFFDAK